MRFSSILFEKVIPVWVELSNWKRGSETSEGVVGLGSAAFLQEKMDKVLRRSKPDRRNFFIRISLSHPKRDSSDKLSRNFSNQDFERASRFCSFHPGELGYSTFYPTRLCFPFQDPCQLLYRHNCKIQDRNDRSKEFFQT